MVVVYGLAGIGSLVVLVVLYMIAADFTDYCKRWYQEWDRERRCSHRDLFELPVEHKKGFSRICKGCLGYVKCDSEGNLL